MENRDYKYEIFGNRVSYEYEDHPVLEGERMSTNGHYTGEHLGSPTQDHRGEHNGNPYAVEDTTIRYGTMTQDRLGNPEVAEIFRPLEVKENLGVE